MKKTAPIGIFDSGIGGLTVAGAIHKILPNERLVYFGDTAHLPYGDKSAAAIQAYSVKITDLLIRVEACKVIVIACNSASSASYELLKEYSASKCKMINVIDPMVDHILKGYEDNTVGLIGTKQTISSNVYQMKLMERGFRGTIRALSTPLLVPMIEEGFVHDNISRDIISNYLGNKDLEAIDAIILGCTHYPLITDEIREYFRDSTDVLDSSHVTASHVHHFLRENDLLNSEPLLPNKFYVSDYTQAFETMTKIFFGELIHLEHNKLWE